MHHANASSMESNPVTFPSGYLELRTTTFGGRSLFAICGIKPGTRIHSSEAPFAHVIYKDYRREVCAQCFAYSASDQTPLTVGAPRTWNVKWIREGATTAWFCNEICKEIWECDEASSLLMEVDAILTKSRTATRKKSKTPQDEVKVKAMLPSFEACDKTIDQAIIDQAWETAEALVSSKAGLTLYFSALNLEDMELEIARLFASAIVHRYSSDRLDPSDPSQPIPRKPWSQLLDLQKNELPSVRTRPYMLSAHLRIYAFLHHALPRYLKPYMNTIREVLSRDTGNSFGIWDGDRREEMMGWGIWISASYFNHSCTPNIRKMRQGRVLHFEATREIQAGEELCISYIDTDAPADQRRRELEGSWFFTCRCCRCEKELLSQ
ncbi:SET domain-containing protein [Gyrodon lividus]|nr:SET domain-containing protein [Gyrodon lividus]